jgi:hypothetical protein
VGQTTAAGGDGAAIKKQFAAVIELDDAVAEQARALPGLVRNYPRCEVVRCGPFRAPRLMLAHAFLPVQSNSRDAATNVTPAMPHRRLSYDIHARFGAPARIRQGR